jgi:hypothetical protein
MNDVSANEIETLIGRFRWATFPQRFERLRAGYETALLESRKTTPRFNVFGVLGVGRREVKTHSALLADLLMPDGTHDHRSLFLEAFLQQCRHRQTSLGGYSFPKIPNDIEKYEWAVEKEWSTELHGRMDIVIQCKELGFLCIIENKVSRQPGKTEGEQLEAYWNWMKTECDRPDGRALIFLTPDRRKAVTADPEVDYFTMNYSDDIYTWLTAVLPEVESPLVKTVVQQYRQLILTL